MLLNLDIGAISNDTSAVLGTVLFDLLLHSREPIYLLANNVIHTYLILNVDGSLLTPSHLYRGYQSIQYITPLVISNSLHVLARKEY